MENGCCFLSKMALEVSAFYFILLPCLTSMILWLFLFWRMWFCGFSSPLPAEARFWGPYPRPEWPSLWRGLDCGVGIDQKLKPDRFGDDGVEGMGSELWGCGATASCVEHIIVKPLANPLHSINLGLNPINLNQVNFLYLKLNLTCRMD